VRLQTNPKFARGLMDGMFFFYMHSVHEINHPFESRIWMSPEDLRMTQKLAKLQERAGELEKFKKKLIPKILEKTQKFFTAYYGPLPILWAKQVPYTVIKLVGFEEIAEAMFKRMPKPKDQMSTAEQLGVILTAGYVTGTS
jgi:hypothetical protein